MGKSKKVKGNISTGDSTDDNTEKNPIVHSNIIDEEEKRLEALLFGQNNEDLLNKFPAVSKGNLEKEDGDENTDDSFHELFHIDKGPENNSENISKLPFAEKRKPAWSDDSHSNISVSLQQHNRLKKLRTEINETAVSGVEYEKRLRSQFEKMHPQPSWAEIGDKREGPHSYSDDDESTLSRTAEGYLQTKSALLLPDILEITKMKDANQAEYSNCVIQASRFHPDGQFLFTAGYDKSLRIFQIDGKTNSKVQSVFFDNFPIHDANYAMNGHEIVLSGRRKYFYVYNLDAQKSLRVSGIQSRDEKSLESFSVSPDGRLIAFLGNDGNVIFVSQQTKQFLTSCKMNGDVRSLAFSSDGMHLYSHGTQGTVYLWDLRYLQPMAMEHKFRDLGTLTGLSMSVGGNYLATGSDSGIVNIYDRDKLDVLNPEPLKSIMNLTTPIQQVQFNHDCQLLGMSSRSKKDSFRLVHLPTMRVFQNWPTNRTPLHYVQTFDFSPHSGYLSIGNDKGRVLLYKLNHYSKA